jgi:hypothetical protein
MTHYINLTIQTLSVLPFMMHLENLLQCLYSYFTHSCKRHLKFIKLSKLMATKGNKILWNVQTRWISTLNPIEKIMQNTKLWRWPWITLQANKLCCIMITFVTFRFWLNLFAFCHCWNLCMLSSNLHNLHMYLCVIWWQQSRFVNVIFIVCIMIKFPSYYR